MAVKVKIPTQLRASAGGAGERVVVYITGDGLKTLDAVKGSFEVTEIAPRFEDFEAALGVHA